MLINSIPSPANITELKENEVFVFGSNEAGRHGAGAAKLALERFGAVYGGGVGFIGQSWAIPTKDRKLCTLSLDEIKRYVNSFIADAPRFGHINFLVTEVGCGLAGYTPEEIAPLFRGALAYQNVHLPQRFLAVLEAEEKGRVLVGMVGPKQVGKSSASDGVLGGNVKHLYLARPLYEALAALFGVEVYKLHSNKNATLWTDLTGSQSMTVRDMLEFFGTTVIRNQLSRHFFVERMLRQIYATDPSLPIIVDDVRFLNEAAAIKALGGVLFRIEKATGLPKTIAEQEVDDIVCDYTVHNDGHKFDLSENVKKLLSEHYGREFI